MGIFKKETGISFHIETIVEMNVINNWAPVDILCGTINLHDSGAKEAAKALRKKMRSGTPQQQLNVISLIQAMMDRCGSKFKAELATVKFVQQLEETIWSGWTDVTVRTRLVQKLGDWAQACAGDPGLVSIQNLNCKVLSDPYVIVQYRAVQHPIMTREQREFQIMMDVELADSNAHMLHEAVIYANPELEAVEENELIKEFYSKCVTLHRGMQIYLAEVVESSEPNEVCLAGILSANEELARALTSYGQMMDRRLASRALAATTVSFDVDTGAGVSASAARVYSPAHAQQDNSNLMSFSRESSPTMDSGKGVVSYTQRAAAQDISEAAQSAALPEPSIDPFADEPYYISGPTGVDAHLVSSVIRSGKQRDESAHGDHQEEGLSPQEREQLLRMLRDDTVVGSSSFGAENGGSSSSTTIGLSAAVSPV